MEKILKGVCVGAGYFSRYHLDGWNRIPEVQITALCDPDQKRAEDRMQEFGIARRYSDYRGMIEREKPDFVDVITPPSTHLQICRHAAECHIAIICQKPLAPTLAASKALVESTRQHGVRFMVHDNWRWQPWYREIKKIIETGTLGRVSLANFQMRMGDGWGSDAYLDRQPYFRDYPQLLIYETGVHFIDTFRFLFGEVEKVYAHLVRLNPVIKGEDAGQILFVFKSGVAAILDANRYNENETGVNLYACPPRTTFGILRLDGLAGHLIMDSCGDLTIKKLGQPSYHHAYPHEEMGFAGDSCFAAQRHFVDSLLKGTEFETNGRDYLKTLAIVDACYRSAETGNPEYI